MLIETGAAAAAAVPAFLAPDDDATAPAEEDAAPTAAATAAAAVACDGVPNELMPVADVPIVVVDVATDVFNGIVGCCC